MIGIDPVDQFDPVNGDRPFGQVDKITPPRQVIGAFAIDMNGGKSGRALQDWSGKLAKGINELPIAGPDIAGLGDRPFQIIRGGSSTKGQREIIALGAILDEGDGLGRFPQRNRQNARC